MAASDEGTRSHLSRDSPSSSLYPNISDDITDFCGSSEAAALLQMADGCAHDGAMSGARRPHQRMLLLSNAAQLYFITPDDVVESLPGLSDVEFYVFTDNVQAGHPGAFIKVGQWTFPLIKGCSPVLLYQHNHFIFPDLENSGAYVVLVIAPPATAADDGRDMGRRVHSLLEHHAMLLLRQPEPYTGKSTIVPQSALVEERVNYNAASDHSTASQLSSTLAAGGEILARGVTDGAAKLSRCIGRATTYWIDSSSGDGGHEEERAVNVDQRLQSSLSAAEQVSSSVVTASDRIVGAVGQGTVCLARYLAPHVRTAGTQLLRASGVVSSNNNEGSVNNDDAVEKMMDNVVAVGGGLLSGLGSVFWSLERAGRQLTASVADSTVRLVHHGYGDEAAVATAAALGTAGNLLLVGHNARALGAKALAKRVAKDTGRQVLHADQ